MAVHAYQVEKDVLTCRGYRKLRSFWVGELHEKEYFRKITLSVVCRWINMGRNRRWGHQEVDSNIAVKNEWWQWEYKWGYRFKTHCKDDIAELVSWEESEEKVEDDAEVSKPGHLGEWTWQYLICRPIREAGSGKIMAAFEYFIWGSSKASKCGLKLIVELVGLE